MSESKRSGCCGGSSVPPPSDNNKSDPRSGIVFDQGQMSNPREKLEKGVKLVLLGEMNSGKTSLVYRLVKNSFVERMEPTIGAAFMVKNMIVDGVQVKLEIWDTAGQERYRSLAPMYYRGAAAAILVYDITRKSSFDTMRRWVQELQKQAAPNIVLALAGNKCDLQSHREVLQADLDKYMQELLTQGRKDKVGANAETDSFIAMECSAKTGISVNELFTEICRKLIQLYK